MAQALAHKLKEAGSSGTDPAGNGGPVALPPGAESADSLFERCWWVYALCREHLFADHTEEIALAFAPVLQGAQRCHMVEVGCGPGFYSRKLAALFPQLRITGIDLSERLLERARSQAKRAKLNNCAFLKANVYSLSEFPETVDAVVASRLFLILPDRDRVLQALFHSLRPGGVCFIAEPVSSLRASLPLWMMRAAALLRYQRGQLERRIACRVLDAPEFQRLVASQPWQQLRTWHDGHYQYALCEKAPLRESNP